MAANEEASASASASFLLDDLPTEVLFHITKFINQSDLFTLSQVSQQFNEVILIPGVINTIRCHYFLLQSNKFYEKIVTPRGEFIKELIVDDIVTDGQVRRLLSLCPKLLKFEQREAQILCEVTEEATQEEIQSALADYCKQVEEVKLKSYLPDYVTPELQKLANECQQLTSLSDSDGPISINTILPIIADSKWPRLAKILYDGNAIDFNILSSLPITHLKSYGAQRCTVLENLLNGLPHLQHIDFARLLNLDSAVKIVTSSFTSKQLTSVKLGCIKTATLEILVNSCPMIEFADLLAESTADESTDDESTDAESTDAESTDAESIVDESILHTIGQGWKNLKDLKFVAMFTIKTKNILLSFGQCSQLCSVDFTFPTITDAILAENITCLPKHLKHFRLSCKSAGDLTAKAISANLVNITSATYHSFTSAAYQHLFNMRHLSHLTVSDAQFINNEGIATLAQSNCASTLQSLEFSHCYNLTDKCFSWFTKLRKLRKLIVKDMVKVTDDAIQALTQCDEFCKRLQHLEIIGGGRFGLSNIAFIFLEKFSDLRTCRLQNFIQITETGVQDFFNYTKSKYLINVQFSKYRTRTERIPDELIESRLNNIGKVIDSYYRTEFSN